MHPVNRRKLARPGQPATPLVGSTCVRTKDLQGGSMQARQLRMRWGRCNFCIRPGSCRSSIAADQWPVARNISDTRVPRTQKTACTYQAGADRWVAARVCDDMRHRRRQCCAALQRGAKAVQLHHRITKNMPAAQPQITCAGIDIGEVR